LKEVLYMAFADEQLVAARREVMSQPMLEPILINNRVIRISSEIPAGYKTWEFKTTTRYGTAVVITSRATNVPLYADAQEENIVRVYQIKEGFDTDEDELVLARANGMNAMAGKMLGVRDQVMMKLEDIGFLGETATTCKGLSNYPGINIDQLPDDGVDAANSNAPSRRLSHKTNDQVLRDLNLIASGINARTAGTVNADTLVIGHDVALYLQNRIFNDRGENLLGIFLANQRVLSRGIRNLIAYPGLDGVGLNGSSRAITYYAPSRYNKFHIPQDGGFQDSGVDKSGDVYYVECKAKTAGIEVQRIKEMSYTDIVI
jgi:hypothetical protein